MPIARPSVQSLLIHMEYDGQVLASGTGFVVVGENGPVLVTNRHNVTGRNQESGVPLSATGGVPNIISITHSRLNRPGEWVVRKEALYIDDKPAWTEHPTLKEKADIVALPLTQLEDVHLFPYDLNGLGPNIFLGPADAVSVIGFPFGMTAGGSYAVWATGFIASEPDLNFNDLPMVLIDCRSRQGQSGSPVIAYRSGGMVAMADGSSAAFTGPVWRFIGIYSGRVNPESDLGKVWKASAIRQLVLSIDLHDSKKKHKEEMYRGKRDSRGRY